MTDERLCKCDLCKEEFTTTETDWHFGADLIQCKAINICDKCCHHDNGHWATWSEIEYALTEVKRLQRELDTQYEYIEWLEEFAPKEGDYNTAWDAYELAKGIHWTQMEEEE